MFALGIRYLNGWAMATHPASRERSEWPPHPDRVFMALTAAHFETGEDGAERGALEWIEGLGPPAMTVSDHAERSSVTSYVPVNDTSAPKLKPNTQPSAAQVRSGLELLPDRRLRQARAFPVAIPHDPVVYLIWPDAQPTPSQDDGMAILCRKVSYVGHSASLVQMWVEARPPEPTLLPALGASRYRLRVTAKGRLADLEARFNRAAVEAHAQLNEAIALATGKRKKELQGEIAERFGGVAPVSLRPTPSLWTGYAPRPPAPLTIQALRSVFDDQLIVLRKVAGHGLALESTLRVTETLRAAIIAHCPEPVPEWVSGHRGGARSERPHLALVPLPDVGHPHADGHLIGVAIVLPRGIHVDDSGRLLGHFTGFDEFGDPRVRRLFAGRWFEWDMQVEVREERPASLRVETWTAAPSGSRTWATVTPISLDRHPKGGENNEAVIATSCERAGLPHPASVSISSTSAFVGAPHAREFVPLHRKADGGQLRHFHAILAFHEPVIGPVLLGAGRYRGYGLCRPCREER